MRGVDATPNSQPTPANSAAVLHVRSRPVGVGAGNRKASCMAPTQAFQFPARASCVSSSVMSVYKYSIVELLYGTAQEALRQ